MESKINEEIPIEDKLNENEINELKKINANEKYYTRKYYNLFINKIMYYPDKKNSDDYFCLGEYYQFTEKKYEQMNFFYLKAISLGNSNAMYNLCWYYQLTEINYLIINDMCELFSAEYNKYMLIYSNKVELFTQCILYYLKFENDYEQIPENINIFFLYIGKILNECKKSEKRKIIDLKQKREIIEHFINNITTNKKNSKLIIKKYFKELYEVNNEN
jgi:TPR repeat protein